MRQIVGIRVVKALTYLDLLKQLYVVYLLLLVLLSCPLETGNHLYVFYLVNRMKSNFCNFFSLCYHYQVISFKKLYKTKNTVCFWQSHTKILAIVLKEPAFFEQLAVIWVKYCRIPESFPLKLFVLLVLAHLRGLLVLDILHK